MPGIKPHENAFGNLYFDYLRGMKNFMASTERDHGDIDIGNGIKNHFMVLEKE